MNFSGLESTIGSHFSFFSRGDKFNIDLACAADVSLGELSYLDAGLPVLNYNISSYVRLGLLSCG